jgi:hypothetical protein
MYENHNIRDPEKFIPDLGSRVVGK